jgi:hypothetical protein
MATPEVARAAGAALSMITGVDLAAEKLKTRPPEGFHAGPSDDPDLSDGGRSTPRTRGSRGGTTRTFTGGSPLPRFRLRFPLRHSARIT